MSHFGYGPPEAGTDAELLELTRSAIARITMHGQAYGSDGRTLTRADLKALQQQADWLEAKIAAADQGVVTNLARLTRE